MTYLRCLLLLVGGCGLISSDVTDFQLKSQPHMFTVDTGSYMVNQTAANTYLGQSCAGAPTECAQWVQSACTTNCSGSCDTASQKCDLGLNVGVYQKIDIYSENPEFAKASGHVTVTVDALTYQVNDNSLNVETPELTVYIAPMSVMSPSDPMAMAIGTIPAIPPGPVTTPVSMNMMFTADGQANLATTMGNYMTPFNVIVGSTIVLKSGDAFPTGKLDAQVEITAHATW